MGSGKGWNNNIEMCEVFCKELPSPQRRRRGHERFKDRITSPSPNTERLKYKLKEILE